MSLARNQLTRDMFMSCVRGPQTDGSQTSGAQMSLPRTTNRKVHTNQGLAPCCIDQTELQRLST